MKRAIDDCPWLDAVDGAREAYNAACAGASNAAVDSTGCNRAAEEVAKKLATFVRLFSPRVVVSDALSQKVILDGDSGKFQKRYQTVFRESGPSLHLAVRARCVFVPAPHQQHTATADALVLDYERHSSLVTPVGAMLDGTLGLRGPRTQDLWALYAVRGHIITALWLCPPPEGTDATLTGETALAALKGSSRQWVAFTQIIERHLGSGFASRVGPLLTSRLGSFEMQGRRPTQEDRVSMKRLAAPHLARPGASYGQYLGLFDGHGGAGCAGYVADHLHAMLEPTDEWRHGDVSGALERAFPACEASFLAESESPSGACALVVVLLGGSLYTAHLGDSRAVLCTGDDAAAVRLTEDHKPNDDGERARIVGAGGNVVWGGRCWRVTHSGTSMMLATSRSFGDRDFKQTWQAVAAAEAIEAAIDSGVDGDEVEAAAALAAADAEAAACTAPLASASSSTSASSAGGSGSGSSGLLHSMPPTAVQQSRTPFLSRPSSVPSLLSTDPTISRRPISPQDRFVILACDGVWDVLSDQQACDSVRGALEEPHGDADAAARKLAGDAFSAGSEDNISVIVCVLHHALV